MRVIRSNLRNYILTKAQRQKKRGKKEGEKKKCREVIITSARGELTDEV